MLWRSLTRTLLQWCQLVRRPDMVAYVTALHPAPNEMTKGVILVVRDRGLQKWACMRCPGGCGERIQLSLSETRRPRWSITIDALGRPTVSPSVHVLNECRCHFWVRRGAVEWVADNG